MKYAILALGLLVTPAGAETFNADECSFIKLMINNCAMKDVCKPLAWAGGGQSRAYMQLVEAHPKFDMDKFDALCQQLCDGKTAQPVALHKYCLRPKS